MKTIVLDIETIADRSAMAKCGYQETEGSFAPWPLHQIACASLLSVTTGRTEGPEFALQSLSRGVMSERSIISLVERAIGNADQIMTYNGRAFDLPVLLARAIRAEEFVPTLARLAHRCRPGLHYDLHSEVKGVDGGIKLAHLCAAFEIPAKSGGTGEKVRDLAQDGRWNEIEYYCESDVISTWLAAQMWDSAENPGFGRSRWHDLAGWLNSAALPNPRLALFAAGPPRSEHDIGTDRSRLC